MFKADFGARFDLGFGGCHDGQPVFTAFDFFGQVHAIGDVRLVSPLGCRQQVLHFGLELGFELDGVAVRQVRIAAVTMLAEEALAKRQATNDLERSQCVYCTVTLNATVPPAPASRRPEKLHSSVPVAPTAGCWVTWQVAPGGAAPHWAATKTVWAGVTS